MISRPQNLVNSSKFDLVLYNKVMNWGEIEHRASIFDAAQQAQYTGGVKPLAQLQEERFRRLEQTRKFGRTEANDGLERLLVREVLEAIRKDVWGEGKVVPFDSFPFPGGFILESDPYPVFQVYVTVQKRAGEDQMRKEVQVREIEIGISETTTSLFVHFDTYKSHGMVRLYVRDNNLVDVRGGASAINAVRHSGLEGLYRISDQGTRLMPIYSSGVDPNAQDATDRLYSRIFRHTEYRRVNGSLPGEIRSWGEGRKSELPFSSPDSRWINFERLQAWQNQLRVPQSLAR